MASPLIGPLAGARPPIVDKTAGRLQMHNVLRAGLLAGAAVLLSSIGPIGERGPSAETLAMLDPSRQGKLACGQGNGNRLLRQRLQLAALLAAPAAAAVPGFLAPQEGLDGLNFPLTTTSDLARRHFLQGLMWSYGFNHAGAIASFREAQRLDPNCALCFWGEAFAHGPNINAPMDPASLQPTLAAVARAQALRGGASPPEQAMIDAIAVRYSADPRAERASLDAAYADAMLAAARRFPAVDDIALLAAEAVMDTTPWNYWQPDQRTPQARVGEAVDLVESVIGRNPDHPQAAHLYIHLMENSVDPRRAERAADRLAKPLAPGSGHLVHMPAHIYYRLGRWEDSIRSNIVAARADEAYIQRSGDRSLVRYGYYPHNVHFIVTSAQMAGDMRVAIDEAQRLQRILDPVAAERMPWVQAIYAAPYFSHAQFAPSAQVLRLPPAPANLPYVIGMRHYARALAYAQRRDRRGFNRELAGLRSIRANANFELHTSQGMPAPDLLLLAETAARGRLALALRHYDEAIVHFREAAAIEDRIAYMEPPWFYYPVRQSLGAALYRAGRFEEARRAFRESLLKQPGNGWALYGLAETERALGHNVEAAATRDALDRAWLGDERWLRMERL
jgi:tetratricopeptide (TPR) repeat protein